MINIRLVTMGMPPDDTASMRHGCPTGIVDYMTKLRQKLAACDDFEIKTVRGLGYKAVIRQ